MKKLSTKAQKITDGMNHVYGNEDGQLGLAGEDKFQVLVPTKVWKTQKGLWASKEFNNIYKGYENNMHYETKCKYAHEYEFKSAYLINGSVYKRYVLKKEGFEILKKIELGSCISNSPLNRVDVYQDRCLVVVEINAQKCAQNRKTFGIRKMCVTDDNFR